MKKKNKILKIKIGYKLVDTSDPSGKLLSYGLSPHEAGCREYEIGAWTYPRAGDGPLCLFKGSQHAMTELRKYSMLNTPSYLRLYRCEYVPSAAHKLWYEGQLGPKISTMVYMPKGTVLATQIKLLEAVK